MRPIEEWARTASFSTPLRWGEVEAGVLERNPAKGEGLPIGMWVRVALAWVGIAALGTVFYGASVIGLVLVGLGSVGEGVTWNWVTPAQVAFAVAVMVEVVSFRGWLESRRRGPFTLPVSALNAAASVAAYVVLFVAADESEVSWLPLFVIVAAVCAVVMVVLGLRSKPEGSDPSKNPPRRGPRSTAKWHDYTDARARVLAVLEKRGLVTLDEADRQRLNEMPLGYWEELDGVDEKEWRRILEYRHVGWREFDKSDRRPWPPVRK